MLTSPSLLAGLFETLRYSVVIGTVDTIILPRASSRIYLQILPVGAVSPGLVFIGLDTSDVSQGAWLYNQSSGYCIDWAKAGSMVGGEWHGISTLGSLPVSVLEVRYKPEYGGSKRENDGNIIKRLRLGKYIGSKDCPCSKQ